MPILDVEGGYILFVKRSMASGYAGVDNELFLEQHNDVVSDAKMVEDIVKVRLTISSLEFLFFLNSFLYLLVHSFKSLAFFSEVFIRSSLFHFFENTLL